MNDKIGILDSLKKQREQLKRLLDAKIWISDAPKPTLEETTAQVAGLKVLITELEELIRQRLT